MAFIIIKLASISSIASKLTAPTEPRQAQLYLRVYVCVFVFELSAHQRLQFCLFSCSLSPSPQYIPPPQSAVNIDEERLITL